MIRNGFRRVIAFVIPLLLFGCVFFKTRYEEIPPNLLPLADPVTLSDSTWNWRVKSLGGPEETLAVWNGEPLFLNFWGTWCQPCVVEMPGMQRMYDSLRTDGVRFLFVSNEREAPVQQFIEKTGYTLPIYVAVEDIPPQLLTGLFPTTFLINRKGQIVFRQVGSAKWDDPSVLKAVRSFALSDQN